MSNSPLPPPIPPMPPVQNAAPYPPARPKRSIWRVLGILLVIFMGLFLIGSLACNLVLFAAIATLQGGSAGEDGVTARVAKDVVVRGGNDKIAILPAHGAVDEAMVERVHRYIAGIKADSRIRAVVLEVDSPGGTITASDEIHHMLTGLRASNYRLYVSMKSLAASGGYYISMPAESIYAEPTTITGSIGVIWPAFEMSGLLQKIGVTPEIITSDEAVYKDTASPFKKFTEEDRKYIKLLVNDAHKKFAGIVDTGRRGKLTVPMDQIAIGRVWPAEEAKKLGLIDEIAYTEDVCLALAKAEGISNPTIVRMKDRTGLFDLLGVAANANRGKITLDPKMIYEMQTPRMEYRYIDPTILR